MLSRRNPLAPSALSYCVEKITYEVRVGGIAKHSDRLAYKRSIGHYTLLTITGTAKPPQTLLFFLFALLCALAINRRGLYLPAYMQLQLNSHASEGRCGADSRARRVG
jgi:hypothetical protein